MMAFSYGGRDWRSLRECCAAVGVSYQKARRLCRHYVRAGRDPALAIKWCVEGRVPPMEQKSFKWGQDAERGAERHCRFMEKVAGAVAGECPRNPTQSREEGR